jgi:esterase
MKTMQHDNRSNTAWPIPEGVTVTDVDGYPLASLESGSGRPLLLIHGSFSDYRTWMFQMRPFAERFRVMALSLRHYYPERWSGHGSDFSLAQHASDVAAFIRLRRLSPVHVVGHSRGGGVALLLAMQCPELIASLVLADPRGLDDLLPNRPKEGAADIHKAFATLHRHLAAGEIEQAAAGFVNWLNGPGAWERRPEERRQWLRDNIATADTGEMPGVTCDAIARFSFPVLLLTGERSPAIYAAGIDAMRACNPIVGAAVTIRDAAHAMHQDNPEEFNASVLQFLKDT